MDLVRSELEDAEVVRFDSLEDVADLCDPGASVLRMLVVSERAAEQFCELCQDHSDLLGDTTIVFTYEDIDFVLSLRPCPGLDDTKLRYLPVRCPVDAWLALLKILYLRQETLLRELFNVDTRSRPELQGRPIVTVREREILAKVSEGLRNKCIANELGLSEHTVKLHLHKIFGKIGVGNRAGAAAWYLSDGRND